MPPKRPSFRRKRSAAERVAGWTGGAVLGLLIVAGMYFALTMEGVPAFVGLLLLVLVLAVLFSRRFG